MDTGISLVTSFEGYRRDDRHDSLAGGYWKGRGRGVACPSSTTPFVRHTHAACTLSASVINDRSISPHPRLLFGFKLFLEYKRLSFPLQGSMQRDRCVYIYICVCKEAGGFESATCPPFYLEPVTVANFVPRPNLSAVPFPRTNRAYDDRDRAKSFK